MDERLEMEVGVEALERTAQRVRKLGGEKRRCVSDH